MRNNETVTCSANAHCVAVGGKCGFAGERDWRLPNVKELQSIVNYQNFDPSVSRAFHNSTCVAGATVTGGSCTAAVASPGQGNYWSSTSLGNFSNVAWLVNFAAGSVFTDDKFDALHVRAVRGGSP